MGSVGLPGLAVVCEGSGIKGAVATSGLVVRCCFWALQLLAFSQSHPRRVSSSDRGCCPDFKRATDIHQDPMDQMEMAGKSVERSRCRRRKLCAGLFGF